MAQVFRSGAFLQQCWAVHPLCIAVKRLAGDRTLILQCTSCRFAHHLALASVSVRAAAVLEGEEHARIPAPEPGADMTMLAACLGSHPTALSLREMDVFVDEAIIRCAECRRHYALQVAEFETHQK